MDLRDQLRAVVAGALSLRPPEADSADPLAGRELDSVGIIHLLAALEDHFEISIPPEEIQPGNFRSLASLAAMIERLRDS